MGTEVLGLWAWVQEAWTSVDAMNPPTKQYVETSLALAGSGDRKPGFCGHSDGKRHKNWFGATNGYNMASLTGSQRRRSIATILEGVEKASNQIAEQWSRAR